MIQSMTGFAVATTDFAGGTLNIELRGVNSRYLDLHFRVADELRAAEPGLRELIGAKVVRGKVECRVSYVAANADAQVRDLGSEALLRLVELQRQVRAVLHDAPVLTVADVLRSPGVFGNDAIDQAALVPACIELARTAIADFHATRGREGEKLADIIRERLARIHDIVARVAPHIPAAQAAFEDRLRQRLLDAIGSVDDERVRQEIALFSARIDVAEELARLGTHVAEVERVLKAGGVVGKRLDFLMQELNREANTLGSKSVVTEVSAAAMDLKLLIEQMREQIQNLE
jgi:uncharacterized protein (TIGR00255 family)